MTQIAISNIGLCTPLGQTPEAVLARLNAGDTGAMKTRDDLLFERPVLVGEVGYELPLIPDSLSQFNSRNNQLALMAALPLSEAIARARKEYGAHRIGIVIGTSTSGISKGEEALKYHSVHGQFPQGYHYSQQELGDSSQFLRAYFELSGPCYTVSTACSSSAKAFASAKRLLQAGLCDLVIVGGVDSLCKLTLNGFNALASISKGHCQPFSANRDGINIGEGAALFTLEKMAADKGCIVLAGVGESSDAHHVSAPHPEGRGAVAAMRAAICDANIQPADIDYVNLHGTATVKNDAMESRAISRVFGDRLPFCSSTKPLTGHTLGAAGAIEAAFCYLLLSDANKTHQLPPQVWDQQQDPDNPVLPLVKKGQGHKARYLMSNSFAFGGSNASLILSRIET